VCGQVIVAQVGFALARSAGEKSRLKREVLTTVNNEHLPSQRIVPNEGAYGV
jgi:hypothetical protein